MSALPPIRAMPTADLLALLLGGEAAALLAGLPLVDIFALHAGSVIRDEASDYGPGRIIEAAKELMTRALAESLQRGDCLTDPAAIKNHLRQRLADLSYEVFAVLLLDTLNRLIDYVEFFRGTLSQTSA